MTPDGSDAAREPSRVASAPVSMSSQAGQPAAYDRRDWERIVREQQPRVRRLALRLTGSPADADDLTHDVFVRVFNSLHTFREGNFDAWVNRVTLNLFRDRWRRRSRILIDPVAPDDLVAAQSAGGLSTTTEDAWAAAHLDVDVVRALSALPAPYRAAVVLCDVEGLGHDEAATVLNVRPGTVRSRLHRGRSALRASLAHRAPCPLADTGVALVL